MGRISKGYAYWNNWVYIRLKAYASLIAKQEKFAKSKDEQLPQDKLKKKMLKTIHDYFIEKDRGYSFEKFAADIIMYMDDAVASIDTTRPFKDGGFDAEGRYKIFKNVDNSIYVDFYVQAKCYAADNAVRVPDTARLISRIKDRQFGIMITTSYVADQAYKEVIDDGHPIVFINGRDIIEFVFNELEIRSDSDLSKWLNNNYGD